MDQAERPYRCPSIRADRSCVHGNEKCVCTDETIRPHGWLAYTRTWRISRALEVIDFLGASVRVPIYVYMTIVQNRCFGPRAHTNWRSNFF
jgi:hypothetical protein